MHTTYTHSHSSLNNNNTLLSLTTECLAVWKIGVVNFIYFEGKPRWLTARVGNESNKTIGKDVTRADPMHSPGLFEDCRKRKSEKGRDASFTEWDRICCPFSSNVNICGWLVLASELSAVWEGLALICCDSKGKGQRGGEAGEVVRRVRALCPSQSSNNRQAGLEGR